MRVLICGCGDVGLALGRALAQAGHHVAGTRRPGADLTALQEAGLQPLHADFTDPSSLTKLPGGWEAAVFCAAPDTGSVPAYRSVYYEATRHLVDWLRPQPLRAFVFTGSTSVYGQTDGSEVDESATADPASATAQVLRETEELLAAEARLGFPAIRLRVAGIYGPGRNRIDALRRGDARITGDGSRWMNHVHRDDVGGAILTVLERGHGGTTYNVSDGAPVREKAFYDWLCPRLGVDPPLQAPGDTFPTRLRSFSDKRVIAQSLREELGWRPQYPSFREGYAGLLAP